jgi:hypothetical protein
VIQDLLRKVKPGEPVSAAQWNELIRLASGGQLGRGTFSDSTGTYTRPRSQVGVGFIRFELTETLETTDTFAIDVDVIGDWGSPAQETTVDVANHLTTSGGPRLFSGVAGDFGIAVWDDEFSVYRIIVLNIGEEVASAQATHIEFALTAALALTDADTDTDDATVTNYWGGTDPGAAVKLYNKSISANYMFEGITDAEGLAVHDDRADKYRIIQLECPSA